MRKSGELVQWNDERGFGFIRDRDGERSFVHISAIRRTTVRPQAGARVTFVPGTGEDGRPVATAVVLMGVEVAPASSSPARPSSVGTIARIVGALLIIACAFIATQLGRAPTWLPIGYLVLGIVSIGLYWNDKSAAEDQRWRTKETTLHGADLAGGTAGGLVAQALLRHKTRKPGFAVTSALIALLHLVALATLIASPWIFPAFS